MAKSWPTATPVEHTVKQTNRHTMAGLHAACSMQHAACCILHAACCMLHAASCMLHAACCMSHAACCMSHATCCMSHAARCTLHVASCMLHAAPPPVHSRAQYGPRMLQRRRVRHPSTAAARASPSQCSSGPVSTRVRCREWAREYSTTVPRVPAEGSPAERKMAGPRVKPASARIVGAK